MRNRQQGPNSALGLSYLWLQCTHWVQRGWALQKKIQSVVAPETLMAFHPDAISLGKYFCPWVLGFIRREQTIPLGCLANTCSAVGETSRVITTLRV